MKLNSFLVKSRHGIYYLRLQRNGTDRRISLRTRDPDRAMYAAYQFGVEIFSMKNISTYDAVFPDGTRVSANGEDDHRRLIEIMAIKRANEEAMLAAMAAIPDDVFSFLHTNQSKQSVQPTSSPGLLPAVDAASVVTLRMALDEYYPVLEKKKIANKTKGMAKTALNKMLGMLGADFNMQCFSNKVVKHEWMFERKNEMTFRSELVDNDIVNTEVKWTTIKRELSAIRVFSKWAAGEDLEYCPSPLTLTIPEGEDDSEPYEKFTRHELKDIFNALPSSADEPWKFWIPILGLFTGARISEPSDLRVAHFDRESKIDIMFLPGSKTDCAPRWIPIHPDLISLGLLDFVEMRRKSGADRLFDFPISPSNGAGAAPSKWFAGFLDALKITDKTKVFHSFRHSLIGLLKNRGSDVEARCQYVGHSSVASSVHRDYGGKDSGLGMPLLKSRVVDLIDWHGYHEWSPDITLLKLKADEFLVN